MIETTINVHWIFILQIKKNIQRYIEYVKSKSENSNLKGNQL